LPASRYSRSEGGDFGDQYKTYQIDDGIYWVGFADLNAGFSNNPYLLVTGQEAVLIDPGSILHYHVVAKKVMQIVKPEQISAIIVQHQDPDLCASIPKFEALIERPIKVVVPPRSALFMPYYGITSELVLPGNRDTLAIAGRELQFYATPYVHFAGSMVTMDPQTRTLFSSDVFGGITKDWSLFAGSDYLEACRAFAEPYIGSQEAWLAVIDTVRKLAPSRIAPQHGSIIDDNISDFLDAASRFQVGRRLAGNEGGQEG